MPKSEPNEFIAAGQTPEVKKLKREIRTGIREVKEEFKEKHESIEKLKKFLAGEGYEGLVPEKILERAERLKELKRIGKDDESTSVALALLEDEFESAQLKGELVADVISLNEDALKEIIGRLFSSPTLKNDKESIDLVYQRVKKAVRKHGQFLEKLMIEVDAREGYVANAPEIQGHIDESGVVTPVYKDKES